jgi:hypothetical protein
VLVRTTRVLALVTAIVLAVSLTDELGRPGAMASGALAVVVAELGINARWSRTHRRRGDRHH